jgi:hypothetical protein
VWVSSFPACEQRSAKRPARSSSLVGQANRVFSAQLMSEALTAPARQLRASERRRFRASAQKSSKRANSQAKEDSEKRRKIEPPKS